MLIVVEFAVDFLLRVVIHLAEQFLGVEAEVGVEEVGQMIHVGHEGVVAFLHLAHVEMVAFEHVVECLAACYGYLEAGVSLDELCCGGGEALLVVVEGVDVDFLGE